MITLDPQTGDIFRRSNTLHFCSPIFGRRRVRARVIIIGEAVAVLIDVGVVTYLRGARIDTGVLIVAVHAGRGPVPVCVGRRVCCPAIKQIVRWGELIRPLFPTPPGEGTPVARLAD